MRLTVARKLNLMIGPLQLVGIIGAVALATHLFSGDLSGILRKQPLESADLMADRIRGELGHVAEKARLLAAVSLEDFRSEPDRLGFLGAHNGADPDNHQ